MHGRVRPAMDTLDVRPQLKLNPFLNHGFTGLHRDVGHRENAVDAVLPEHCDEDGPCDFSYRPPGCDKLINILWVLG